MISDMDIEALPVGRHLSDGQVPGLAARRNATGVSFLLYYRTGEGVQRRPKIGSYPGMSIAEARKVAVRMLARVAIGHDPMAERLAARSEPTLDDLAARCERDHYHRTAWHREAMRLYGKKVAPQLGRRRLRDLGYEDIAELHRRLSASPATANRTVAVISRMFNFAERWGWRDMGSNPCRHIERYPERARRRYATAKEIAKLGAALERYAADPAHVSGVAFIHVMLFSGARPSEILNGTPAMLERVEREDGVYGVLRLPNGKTGRRDVFLPPQAMSVIDRLPEDRSTLVGRSTMPRRLWRKIGKEIGCEDLWLRDLRRTFATIALTNGVTVGQVGELLGHASMQTTKIYAKLTEDGAHIAAATVAGKLEELLCP